MGKIYLYMVVSTIGFVALFWHDNINTRISTLESHTDTLAHAYQNLQYEVDVIAQRGQ